MRTNFEAYLARIDVLRRLAIQEGFGLNSASEFDFWSFATEEPRYRNGNLVLLDNGNLRAIWKRAPESHLGLQFLGDGLVQYVIFRQHGVSAPISRVAGRDTLRGLRRQIEAFELHSLLIE